MKEDKTPTGAARNKKTSSHKRLRLEKAKLLKAKGSLTKSKRAEARKHQGSAVDVPKNSELESRLPKKTKNALDAPPRPPAKYRKRQVNKSWLPTHVWHAKRAHMTQPMFPLWRFAIPLTPTEKCYRTTHRAATVRGCVAWDTSFISTIGFEGREKSLISLLRNIGVDEAMLTCIKGSKWRRGTRSHETWIRERDNPEVWIAPVAIFWCPADAKTVEAEGERHATKIKKKIFLRVHPSAFFQVWNDVLKVAKMQQPPVMVEDLRFEFGSIEVTGPGATEALLATLHPVADQPASTAAAEVPSDQPSTSENAANDEWEDFETPSRVWSKLHGLSNPSALPANTLLGFNITDPRLRSPLRTISPPSSSDINETLLQLLADWPPDVTQSASDIYDRPKRLTACRRLASQKRINRRKGDALPGQYPEHVPTDPKVPILLQASRSPTKSSAQGTWKVILPWDFVLPTWYTLIHYPLSTGSEPRFGGLAEQQQTIFESGGLWFPGDFPGTKAGWEWEMRERDIARRTWERKPKGRRVEYTSVDLGGGRKGEIGKGWACDWERLVLGKEAYESQGLESQDASTKAAGQSGRAATENPSIPGPEAAVSPQMDARPPPAPPHNIQQLPNFGPLDDRSSLSQRVLAPVRVRLFASGHPSRAARIYRVPTDISVRDRWLNLEPSSNHNSRKGKKQSVDPAPLNAHQRVALAPHERAQHLASTLLQPPSQWTTNHSRVHPGHPDYPPVPAEEDLIGFVTTASYALGEGMAAAVGNVLVYKALGLDLEGPAKETEDVGVTGIHSRAQNKVSGEASRVGRGKKKLQGKQTDLQEGTKDYYCIIRDSGQGFGRLAKWKFVK